MRYPALKEGLFEDDPSLINTDNNYVYDELGQLITDHQEEIEEIIWRVDGKISRVARETISTRKSLEFVYDAMGNRVAKKVFSDNTFDPGALELVTYYIRDASGNVMSIYEEENGMLNLSEQHIYGSSRLGMRTLRTDMITVPTPLHTGVKEIIRGERRYELTNHLGNVLAVCSDQLTATDGDSNNQIDFYAAEVVSYSDYYPFGAPMIERTSGESRYGFNGKEQDNEYSGEGNTYDFGARMYDGRLGRWWRVDPKYYESYNFSSYLYCSSNPVINIDTFGETDFYFNGTWVGTDGHDNNLVGVVTSKELSKKIIKNSKKGLLFTDSGELTNGDRRKGYFVIDIDILKCANKVLTNAINGGQRKEYSAVMLKDADGKYKVIFEGEGEELTKLYGLPFGKKPKGTSQEESLPSGDVSIHSHPTGADIDKDRGVVYSCDASEPSKGENEDHGLFKDYTMNIIVGKNGRASSKEIPTGRINGGIPETELAVDDHRSYYINIFTSDSNDLIGKLDRSSAISVLSGPKGSVHRKFVKSSN